jgi:hypothetical protein
MFPPTSIEPKPCQEPAASGSFGQQLLSQKRFGLLAQELLAAGASGLWQLAQFWCHRRIF